MAIDLETAGGSRAAAPAGWRLPWNFLSRRNDYLPVGLARRLRAIDSILRTAGLSIHDAPEALMGDGGSRPCLRPRV
jgi:hypothetical protein